LLLLSTSYAALGLVHTLNPLASGGAEHDPTKVPVNTQTILAPEPSHSHAGPSTSTSSIEPIPKGYGKIIRDSDGNVIRVELSADDEERAEQVADKDEMQGMHDPEVDKQVITSWVTELGGGRGSGAAIVQCESCYS
jgi:nucleolar protein 16